MDTSNEEKKYGFILFFIVMAVYFPIMLNGFTYDDVSTLVKSKILDEQLKALPALFSTRYFEIFHEQTFRPIVTLSYLLQAPISFGKPFLFHYGDLLLHFIVVLEIFVFLTPHTSRIAAFVGALYFAVHPVHSEAVYAIGFREDILAAGFTLACILWFRSRPSPSFYEGIVGGVLTLSACLSKEAAVVLPFCLLISDRIDRNFSKKGSRRKYFSVTAFMMLYFYIYFDIRKTPYPPVESYLGATLSERFLYVPVLIMRYFLLILFPVDLSVDHIVAPISGVLDPAFLTSVAGLAIVLSIAYFFRQHMMAGGIIWFLGCLAPVSNIFPLGHPFAERFLYLPMVGMAWLVAGVWHSKASGYSRIAVVTAAVVLLPLSARTFTRGFDFRNQETLFTAAIRIPCTDSAYGNLGVAYLSMGKDPQKAVPLFLKAIEMNPKADKAYDSLGMAYSLLGEPQKAVEAHARAIEITPSEPIFRHHRAVAYALNGDADKAQEDVDKCRQMGEEVLPELLNKLRKMKQTTDTKK